MIAHTEISAQMLRAFFRNAETARAGNRRLKIYGKLDCASGKRMKKENRVFFESEEAAKNSGYRPCGNCMKTDFLIWKEAHGLIQ